MPSCGAEIHALIGSSSLVYRCGAKQAEEEVNVALRSLRPSGDVALEVAVTAEYSRSGWNRSKRYWLGARKGTGGDRRLAAAPRYGWFYFMRDPKPAL
jgi:hypothetical protein